MLFPGGFRSELYKWNLGVYVNAAPAFCICLANHNIDLLTDKKQHSYKFLRHKNIVQNPHFELQLKFGLYNQEIDRYT